MILGWKLIFWIKGQVFFLQDGVVKTQILKAIKKVYRELNKKDPEWKKRE